MKRFTVWERIDNALSDRPPGVGQREFRRVTAFTLLAGLGFFFGLGMLVMGFYGATAGKKALEQEVPRTVADALATTRDLAAAWTEGRLEGDALPTMPGYDEPVLAGEIVIEWVGRPRSGGKRVVADAFRWTGAATKLYVEADGRRILLRAPVSSLPLVKDHRRRVKKETTGARSNSTVTALTFAGNRHVPDAKVFGGMRVSVQRSFRLLRPSTPVAVRARVVVGPDGPSLVAPPERGAPEIVRGTLQALKKRRGRSAVVMLPACFNVAFLRVVATRGAHEYLFPGQRSGRHLSPSPSTAC